jgi:hypothetical protein
MKPKLSQYYKLQPDQKKIIDNIEPYDMIVMLKGKEYMMAARIIGILIDMHDHGVQLTKNQENILKLPWVLCEKAEI